MTCTPNHLLIELGVSRRKEGREIMKDPKMVALILTLEGFIRWTEGKKLRPQDFKPA